MSPTLQAKLLHVLQDGEFSRLGARVNTKVDVRIVAATNINIEEAIAERRFREDLYYRLNTFILHIPPMRERREEIPYLLSELIKRLGKAYQLEPIDLSPRLLAAAVDFNWPGNLRELVNFTKRHLIVRDEAVAIQELESKMLSRKSSVSLSSANLSTTSGSKMKSIVRSLKDQTEIRMIVDMLDETQWNRRIAAERLQISYRALLYKIRQYNLAAAN
jgi:two-component system, NtrC family, response regulator AtoC